MNSKAKTKYITYLLGAGASAFALPVVKKIPEKLQEFRDKIKTYFYENKNRETTNDLDRVKNNKMLNDLDWLIENANKHVSIDTFAKKLFVTKKRTELINLKKLLSLFFIHEQIVNIDKRYDGFIASIVNNDGTLTDRVKIISWNYDYQFEKAFSEYCQSYKLDIIQEVLNISPSPNKPTSRFFEDRFQLLKLNGTTAFLDKDNDLINISNILEKDAAINSFKSSFEKVYKDNLMISKLGFSWEDESDEKKNILKDISKNTEILVVIGYSYPFFNRDIDRVFFNNFKGEKIYIQDVKPEDIIPRLEAFNISERNQKIISINDTEQFFLPPEL